MSDQQMARVRRAVRSYREAPFHSADWLAAELMMICDTQPANDVARVSEPVADESGGEGEKEVCTNPHCPGCMEPDDEDDSATPPNGDAVREAEISRIAKKLRRAREALMDGRIARFGQLLVAEEAMQEAEAALNHGGTQ